MQKLICSLRIFFNVILLSLLLFFGFILIQIKWPGFQTYTDNDAGVLYLTARLFVFVAALILINSTLFFILKHWRIYRLITVFLCIAISILIILSREYFIKAVLGEEESTYVKHSGILSNSGFYINLRLFKEGGFLSESSDYEIVEENTGKYHTKHDTLVLHFENNKSDLIGTKFLKIQDSLICLNCSKPLKLLKQYHTKQSISKSDFPDFNLKSVLEHFFF